MAATMLYDVERPDGSWGTGSRARAVAIAGVRLVSGRGPFTILAPFRRPTSEKAPSLRRRKALDTISRLFGEMHAGDEMRVRDGKDRQILHIRSVPAIDPRRTEMVRWARWGARHEPQIHYSQVRPYRKYKAGTLPLTLDCSSSSITYAHWAGAPDPSGLGFSGAGSTDTLLAHLKHRARIADAELGDLVLWHDGADGKHVAVVIEPGRDPLMASHGSESGPILIRFSVEDRYHASETPTALNLLP